MINLLLYDKVIIFFWDINKYLLYVDNVLFVKSVKYRCVVVSIRFSVRIICFYCFFIIWKDSDRYRFVCSIKYNNMKRYGID